MKSTPDGSKFICFCNDSSFAIFNGETGEVMNLFEETQSESIADMCWINDTNLISIS